MKITVEYFDGKLPIKKIKCTPEEWPSLSVTGVQRVIIEFGEYYSFILSGFDYYWVSGASFGLFNDHTSGEYKGKMAHFYTLEGAKMRDFGEEYPVPGTHCLPGAWMPDDLYMKAYGYAPVS